MEKEYILTKNVHLEFFFFFRLLCSKMLKIMESTLYAETKRYYEKRVL